MDSYIIRWAEKEDFRDLACIYAESYRDAYRGIIPDSFLEKVTVEERANYFQQSLSKGKDRTVIMLVNNEAIGLLIIALHNEDNLHNNSAEIAAIYL